MPTATQQIAQAEFGFRIKAPALPTVDLAGARAITGISENVLKVMIESREIGWAWDIASKNSERMERRILAACAHEIRSHPGGIAPESNGLPLSLVLRFLYGPERPFITGKEFYRAWNCDEGLFYKLVNEGSVIVATSRRHGPGGSAKMKWAAAVAFVRERRIPK